MDSVVGNEKNVKFLGKLLGKEIPRLFLFHGTEGVGKRTLVYRFIKDYYKQNGANERVLRKIVRQKTLDIKTMQPSGTIYTVDQVRELLDFVQSRPVELKHKFIIIDDAHLMGAKFSNRCLKMFEDSGDKIIFFLITPNISKIIGTIQSRAFILHFKPLNELEMMHYLRQEKSAMSDKVRLKIGKLSKGSISLAMDFLSSNFAEVSKSLEQFLEGIEDKTLLNCLAFSTDILEKLEITKSKTDTENTLLKKKTNRILALMSLYYSNKILETYAEENIFLKECERKLSIVRELQKNMNINLSYANQLKLLFLELGGF